MITGPHVAQASRHHLFVSEILTNEAARMQGKVLSQRSQPERLGSK